METVYRSVKASYHEAKDRFYRILLVREDLDPVQISNVLLCALGAEFEHEMVIETKGKTYFPDCPDMPLDCVPMSRCTIGDLENGFHLVYDLGECWDFDCKVYKRKVTREDDRIAILVEGKGQGIWEDDRYTLESYLSGRIGPKIRPEDEENGFYTPWNYAIEKYSDFDTCYDIEEEQERLDEELPDLIGEGGPAEEIGEFVMNAAIFQIAMVPEVKKEYERLCRRHEEEEAIGMIYEALTGEVLDLLTLNGPSGREHYLAKIRKLK